MSNKLFNGKYLSHAIDLYRSYNAIEIELVYEGKITHQITKTFLSLIEETLTQNKEPQSVKKKVFHVLVECLQNITKHTDFLTEKNQKVNFGKGILIIGKNDNNYIITTGNLLKNQKVKPILKTLNNINHLDKEQLRELYIKQLKEGKLTDKGGAGLGFIDIARKTGQKIKYEILPINDLFSLFVLTMTISRKTP